MSVVKSLWASIQGNPALMRRVNGWLTLFWLVMIPISMSLGLLGSVTYVSALSLWALVSGHWSAWQAARVEVEQMAEAHALESNPIEKRVVDELIERTDVMPADETAGAGQDRRPDGPPQVDVSKRLADLATRLADLQRELDDVQMTSGGQRSP